MSNSIKAQLDIGGELADPQALAGDIVAAGCWQAEWGDCVLDDRSDVLDRIEHACDTPAEPLRLVADRVGPGELTTFCGGLSTLGLGWRLLTESECDPDMFWLEGRLPGTRRAVRSHRSDGNGWPVIRLVDLKELLQRHRRRPPVVVEILERLVAAHGFPVFPLTRAKPKRKAKK